MRFSIRDLLWTTALVAMGMGWWVDYRHRAQLLAFEAMCLADDVYIPMFDLDEAKKAFIRSNKIFDEHNKMRFSIRDLLWTTGVVAIAIVWSVDRHKAAAARRAAQKLSPPT